MNTLTKLHQSQSPILRTLVAAMLLATGAAGGYAVSAQKTVTLDVDGAPMTVSTMKTQVADVLEENGFVVTDRDDVIPAADASIGDVDTIVLRRSRPVNLSLDGQDRGQVWTTASTVDEALAQLSMRDTAPAAASRASRLPLAGMALPVVCA